MADLVSILSTAYKSSALSSASGSSRYVAVDSRQYQGNWSGTYPDGKSFSLGISASTAFGRRCTIRAAGRRSISRC